MGSLKVSKAMRSQASPVIRHRVTTPSVLAPEAKVQRRVIRSILSGARGIQRAKYKKCDKEKKKQIEEGIAWAKPTARKCAEIVNEKPENRDKDDQAALIANFGNLNKKKMKLVYRRFKHIASTVEDKKYICRRSCSSRTCGVADCSPKKKYKKIWICPDFGKEHCPVGVSILHEAVHNAGACRDVHKGSGYPPANAHNNSYSYESFALDVEKSRRPVVLPRRTPRRVKPIPEL